MHVVIITSSETDHDIYPLLRQFTAIRATIEVAVDYDVDPNRLNTVATRYFHADAYVLMAPTGQLRDAILAYAVGADKPVAMMVRDTDELLPDHEEFGSVVCSDADLLVWVQELQASAFN